MASQSFSLNIDALPAAGDTLGPVDHESTLTSDSTSQSNSMKPPPTQATRTTDNSRSGRTAETSTTSTNTIPSSLSGTASPPRQSAMSQAIGTSSQRSSSPLGSGSPNRGANPPIRSASPRHLSPATSQIFERDVQEPVNVLGAELSPAIPAHFQTEDKIPAVLEASSLAITDKALSPSDVEIVMHAAHQPAAVAVPTSHAEPDSADPATQSFDAGTSSSSSPAAPENTYAGVDPLDPRRLSFISFADVVHAEHEAHNLPSTSHTPSIAGVRSPSPARSSRPSGTGAAHPHNTANSDRFGNNVPFGSSASSWMLGGGGGGGAGTGGASLEPGGVASLRRGSASIASPHAQTHGDLTIETMAHALEQPLAATAGGVEGMRRSSSVR